MEKIDELKEIPTVGEMYLVPCVLRNSFETSHDGNTEIEWVVGKEGDLVPLGGIASMYYIPYQDVYPIINHLHNDKENGQDYSHYHVDYRFIQVVSIEFGIPTAVSESEFIRIAPHLRYDLTEKYGVDYSKDYKIEYRKMVCLRDIQLGVTGISNIQRSKLKHKCIVKGKCPHRGYDLSQTPDVDGVIKCPLHGLKFNKDTKELIL